MQKGRRTAAGTGMVRSSETTENGDVDADALLKKESPIPTCSGDGAACAVRIVVLSAAPLLRRSFVHGKNDHVGGIETALHAASCVWGKHIAATLNEVLQRGIFHVRKKFR